MYIDNKLEVVKKVIDVIEYIDKNQRTEDFLIYKKILLKLVSSMSDNIALDVNMYGDRVDDNKTQMEIVPDKRGHQEPDYMGEKPEDFDESSCQVYKCSSDCDCDCGDTGDTKTPVDSSGNLIPSISIEDTIAKIKRELGK